MPKRRPRDLVHRFEGNPIITIDDLPMRCMDISNAGVARKDGDYIFLLTVQHLEGTYSIYPARSTDGFSFEFDKKPFLGPAMVDRYRDYDTMGTLDARITPIDGEYFVAFNTLSPHGYRPGLARTKDFESVEFMGLIAQPDTKGVALFSKKIKGRYARLERPWNGGNIWISYSDDLDYWGWPEFVMGPRSGHWDMHRIGTGTPPMEIEEGWLIIYYGIKQTSAGPLFRLGAAVLDRENPAKVVGRTNVPILTPREEYERIGDMPNLVFTCGAVIEDGGKFRLYYGAANSCICLGTTDVERIINACLVSEREF